MTDGNSERPRLVCQVDRRKYDITNCLPDHRAVNRAELTKAIEGSVVEHRLRSITKFKIFPYADAQDLAEWDRDTLLDTFRPNYMSGEDVCADCHQGPCDSQRAPGRCGLSHDACQARISLRAVCHGCLSQMAASRKIVDYALARFDRSTPMTLGKEQDVTDATWMGVMCGFYPETLDQVDRGLRYAESQLGKALVASVQGGGTADDFEQMAFHAGTMLLLAQEVAEYVGISLFGFTSAMNQGLADVAWYPPGFWSGIGQLSREKPTLGFVGDDFIPAWLAIDEMKRSTLTDSVQVVGMGPAGDAIARFYNKVCVMGTMYRVKKALRLGLVDVLVASESCIAIDFLGEVKRTGARLIWTGVAPAGALRDRTGERIEDIVKDLVEGVEGVWVRDAEKAAAVAVQAVQQVKRARWHALDEGAVRQEAARCQADCDLCTFECPNDLLMGQSLRAVADKGIQALFEVEKSCVMCGKCEAICPEEIPIEDVVVAAYGARNRDERYLYRPGRGPVTRSEVASYGFTFLPGNSPGIFSFIGCSNCNPDDIAWMTNRVAEANGIVSVAGCAASDVAHLVDSEGVPLFRKYPFWTHPRSAANLGGCASCQYVPWVLYKYSRAGTGISWCANYAETMDEMYGLFANPTVIWGGQPERMYAIAAGLARTGISVVIGPIQSQQWKRLLGGNKWDWQKYWWYDSLSHEKRACSPSPKDLIFPVETKEEAITYVMSGQMKAAQPFIARMVDNDFYYSWHKEFFGEMPDDWMLYVRTFTDLPATMRFELTEALKEKYGWEVYGLWVESIPHFDGNRYNQKEYLDHYAQPCASYTRLPRLFVRQRTQKPAVQP